MYVSRSTTVCTSGQFQRFHASISPMEDIVCTITHQGEILELVITQVDPDLESSVYCAVLQDEDAIRQTEYFEMDNNTEALDIIKEAIQTIQDGVK